MKITKSQLQEVIRETIQEVYESGAARADREMYLKRMGRESEYLDRANMENLQTMLYKLDFSPFLSIPISNTPYSVFFFKLDSLSGTPNLLL